MSLDGGVRQVACGHDVGDLGPEAALALAGLGEMDFQEAAMVPIQPDERIDGLHHTGTGRPTTADTGGERDDGNLVFCKAA